VNENHAQFGERLWWSARHGFGRYFGRCITQHNCDEAILIETLGIAASEGHKDIVETIINCDAVSNSFFFFEFFYNKLIFFNLFLRS